MRRSLFRSLALIVLAGCNRVSNPVLSTPPASDTAVRMQCPEVENSKFPDCRAFVLVTNQADAPITDFSIGNFTVVEEGKPTVVTSVSKVDPSADPLAVVICLDRSGSMDGKPTNDLNAAAKQFIDNLGSNDSAEIIDFSGQASVTQEFTTNKNLLKTAVDSGVAGGSTALYDAIGMAANNLKSFHGRKYILVITDGFNNASMSFTTPEATADQVNRAGVASYIIGLGTDIDTASLTLIANDTNARYFNAPSSSQLAAYFSQIQNLMQNLVSIRYRSREGNTMRSMSLYINYGSFAQSVTRKYGY